MRDDILFLIPDLKDKTLNWTLSQQRMERVVWIETYTLPCIKQLVGSCCITQGAQPHALWRSRGVGWRFEREWPCIYLWLIHIIVWQKRTHHCKAIILQFKKKIKLLTINMLASLFFIIAHYQKINRFPSISNVLRVFTMNEWIIWSNAFSVFIKMVMWWILFFGFLFCYCSDLHWFSYVTLVLNSWSQCIVLSVHFWIWLANTLRIFFFLYSWGTLVIRLSSVLTWFWHQGNT